MFKKSESYQKIVMLLSKARPRNIVLKCKIEDNIMLVVNEEFSLFFLNETAKEFLLRCDGLTSFKEITRQLLGIYEVEEECLVNDLVDVIQDLQKKRLIYIDPFEVI